MNEPNGTVVYRLGRIEEALNVIDQRVDSDNGLLARHEEQINGDRGLSKAIDVLAEEVKSLRRASISAGERAPQERPGRRGLLPDRGPDPAVWHPHLH